MVAGLPPQNPEMGPETLKWEHFGGNSDFKWGHFWGIYNSGHKRFPFPLLVLACRKPRKKVKRKKNIVARKILTIVFAAGENFFLNAYFCAGAKNLKF